MVKKIVYYFMIMCLLVSSQLSYGVSDSVVEMSPLNGDFSSKKTVPSKSIKVQVSEKVNSKTCFGLVSTKISMTNDDLGPKADCFGLGCCVYTPAQKKDSNGSLDVEATREHRWNVYECSRHFATPAFWCNAVVGAAWFGTWALQNYASSCSGENTEQGLCAFPVNQVFGGLLGGVNALSLLRYCGFHCGKRSSLNDAYDEEAFSEAGS